MILIKLSKNDSIWNISSANGSSSVNTSFFEQLRPLNYDTLAMVVVFGTKTNLAVECTLFFREPGYKLESSTRT